MSGGIQLSDAMVSELKAVVAKHDSAADNDMYFMQYLSAVTGYVMAHQDQPDLEKKGLVGDLSHFMGQVLDQVEQDMKPPEDAFGVWKPGQG